MGVLRHLLSERPILQPWRGEESRTFAANWAVSGPPVQGATPAPLSAAPRGLSAAVRAALAEFPAHQFVVRPPLARDGSWRPETRGVLDLFSGAGRTAKAYITHGYPWVLCFDSQSGGRSQDLSSPALQATLLWLIAAGAFSLVCGGPPCSSFSVCVTPSVRNRAFPAGVPWARESMLSKIKLGNDLSLFMSKCVSAISPQGFFWVENPRTSWMWHQRHWRRLIRQPGLVFWTIDYCRYGTVWKKPTRFLTNLQPLFAQDVRCNCEGRHVELRGSSPFGISWTKVAEAYPHGVAETLAAAAAIADLGRPRRLDVEATARAAYQRSARNAATTRSAAGEWLSRHRPPRRYARDGSHDKSAP